MRKNNELQCETTFINFVGAEKVYTNLLTIYSEEQME